MLQRNFGSAQVGLVADQKGHNGLRCNTVQLPAPMLDSTKSVLVIHIVHENSAIGAMKVAVGDCVKVFLARCVPLWKINRYESVVVTYARGFNITSYVRH